MVGVSDGVCATVSILKSLVKLHTVHPADEKQVRKTGYAARRLVRLECLAETPQPASSIPHHQ